MNWKNEVENLKSKGSYWKPTPGQHEVVFLSDGEEHVAEFEGKTLNKVKFEVEIQEGRFLWDITRGMTKSSLFGQLALVFKDRGVVVGEKINLIVKGEKKDTSYTVIEALTLMTEEKK